MGTSDPIWARSRRIRKHITSLAEPTSVTRDLDLRADLRHHHLPLEASLTALLVIARRHSA
jgi:hypothetical protein